MKFYASVRAADLKHAVTLLRKIRVPKIGIGSKLVRLRINGSRFTIITSDGDLQIEAPVALTGPACGEEVVIDRAVLFQVSKSADRDTPVRFDSSEDHLPNSGIYRGVEISYVAQGFPTTLNTPRAESKDAWPLLAGSGSRHPLDSATIAACRLGRAFSSTDESRSVINGVCLDPFHGGRLISTDGRRMLISPARSVGRPVIIPNTVLDILSHKDLHSGALLILSAEDPDRVKTVAALQFGLSTATITFTCLPGNYPNWQQVIPSDDARTGSIALTPATAKRLLSWLRSKKDQTLTLEPRNSAVLLTRYPTAEKDRSAGRDTATVPAGIIGSPPDKIAFNASFFADALAADLTTLDLIDATSPGVFTNGTARVVLMPMRTIDPAPPVEDEDNCDEETADEEEKSYATN